MDTSPNPLWGGRVRGANAPSAGQIAPRAPGSLRFVEPVAMSLAHYLIFGDLHGRILPAFQLASVWEREHGVRLAGLLQVGDLGYFPDPTRLDRATARHAAADPLELGACLIAEPSREADSVLRADEPAPP